MAVGAGLQRSRADHAAESSACVWALYTGPQCGGAWRGPHAVVQAGAAASVPETRGAASCACRYLSRTRILEQLGNGNLAAARHPRDGRLRLFRPVLRVSSRNRALDCALASRRGYAAGCGSRNQCDVTVGSL